MKQQYASTLNKKPSYRRDNASPCPSYPLLPPPPWRRSFPSFSAKHVFNTRHQFRMYRHVKSTLADDEAVVHIDFSENWKCKYASEIQSVHFGGSQQQVTLHTGVVYYADGLLSFVSISPSLQHGPEAIWAHLKPVLSELKQKHPNVNVIHVYSDGPTTQYRNKLNFYLFSTFMFDLGYDYATWNLFEASHGKGAPDAIGGATKRKADSMVLNGIDIPDAKCLFQLLQASDSVTKVFYVDKSNIDAVTSSCPKSFKTIRSTMKIHQVWTQSRHTISHRNLSCFCTQPTMCTCYAMDDVIFETPVSTEPSNQ